MNIKLKIIVALVFLYGFPEAFSKLNINDVNFKQNFNKGELEVKFKGNIKNEPIVLLKKNILQLTFPASVVWPKIEKKATLGSEKFNTTLLAYQYNKDDVRVRILFKNNHKLEKNDIKIKVINDKILASFPLNKYFKNKKRKSYSSKSSNKIKKNSVGSNALKYDESYLDKLLKDKVDVKEENNEKNNQVNEDEIKLALSGTLKKKEENKINDYLIRFIVFIFIIIGLLYGVFYLFKKGFFKKGNVGFLKNNEGVTILSTTYLGPKKNLLVVKVYDQVLLLGSSEQGVNLITELKDTNTVIKSGEVSLSGSNFDMNLDEASKNSKDFKLKENNLDNLKNNNIKPFKNKKERFSDQIKTKLRDLKPLQ